MYTQMFITAPKLNNQILSNRQKMKQTVAYQNNGILLSKKVEE